MKFEERHEIIYNVLSLAKNNELNNTQKQRLYDIIESLKDKTEIQKRRFYLFYNLKNGQTQQYRICDLAKLDNCSSSRIRQSLNRIKVALLGVQDEILLALKKIIEECKEK